MCGFIAQLVEHRTGIVEVTGSNPIEALIFFFFFQVSSFQLLKLENLLRWSYFTFIYYRSSNMNYFIYTSQNTFVLYTSPKMVNIKKILHGSVKILILAGENKICLLATDGV